MTSEPESAPATTATETRRRRGMAYAVAAASLSAVFLFLPILLLGFTIQVVADVATGEPIAWQSSVGMTYVFIGPVALLSGLLLLIPFALWRRAARIIGPGHATLWTGLPLAGALAGVALIWFVQTPMRSSHATQPESWYALAFALAAVVVLLATVLLARGAIVAAIAVLGAAGIGILLVGASMVMVYGSPPRIPAGAQTVEIISTPSGVELRPETIRAGSVYFIADDLGDLPGQSELSFVSAGYASPPDAFDLPLPLAESGIQALARGDYQGTSIESIYPGISKLTLREGYYAFVIAGRGGELPGVVPLSVTVLEVQP